MPIQATARTAAPGAIAATYERHRPERTLLYGLVTQHYTTFLDLLATEDKSLPAFVQQEFADYLRCGRLEHGFLRVRCEQCRVETLVAFSCKRRGFCPSCGARRMVESATLLADAILPREPLRQWVLSVPYPLRFLFAIRPQAVSAVLGIVTRALSAYLIRKAGRGRGGRAKTTGDTESPTPFARHTARTWAKRLKRVFRIDIETCGHCGGAVRIIACIEDPAVVEQILTHIQHKIATVQGHPRPAGRAPPGRQRTGHVSFPS